VFTAEEIWQNMPKAARDKTLWSVHLLEWPKENLVFAGQALAGDGRGGGADQDLKPIIDLIPQIAKALEEKRGLGEIGSSFDAKINLLTNNEIRYKYLSSFKEELLEIFKVSQIAIVKKDSLSAEATKSNAYLDIAIAVSKADGEKCIRCWNYSPHINTSKSHPLLCQRCIAAIEGERN
jgi:isoleucyl-tRNA synthetase